ncbi:Uncharacterised protein [Mycobacteroides abscessus subsp. abscessus]|nr:Uncharacterised protein [Mycobacteroides abscessus subsp. abscessus]
MIWSQYNAMSVPPATAKPCSLATVGLFACSRLAKPRLKRLIMA